MPKLPVNQACQILVGPVVDDTDFKTLEEAIAYNAAGMDVSLLKQGTGLGLWTATAITLTTSGANDWTHVDGAYYSVEITAAQNNTLGKLKLRGIATGVLAFQSIEYDVVPYNVWLSEVAQEGISLHSIMALIESQRGAHTGQGSIFYVDPENGDSHANGNRGGPDDPYASVQDCHDNAVTDSNHDIIILVAGDPDSVTTLDEQVDITKRYTFIRGPGRDFLWTTTSTGDTIDISADGCELSGFQLETHSAGSGRGVHVSGADFARIKNLFVNATRGSGIYIENSDNCVVSNNVLENSGQSGSGHGVEVAQGGGTAVHNRIENNHIAGVPGDGIRLGNSCDDAIVCSNHIHACTGSGINVVAGANRATLCDNRLGDNTTADITDAGTDTVNVGNAPFKLTDILSDSTAFAGANVDQALSTTESNIRGADSDTLETLSDQLDGIAGGAGVRNIDIATEEADTTPISNVTVTIYTDSARTNELATFSTGITGIKEDFGMNDGTYYWSAAKAGVTFTSGSFTVSAGGTQTLVGTVVSPSTPSAPDGCTVYGTLLDGSGAALASKTVSAQAVTPVDTNGNQIGRAAVTTTTNGSGYFELELLQGVQYKLLIADVGISALYTVPAASSQDLSTWDPD